MIDREKVLNALRCHANCDRGFDCGDCAYIGNGDCLDLLAMDAYALLKEQEPVEPKQIIRKQCKKEHEDGSIDYFSEWYCPHCNMLILRGFDNPSIKFCYKCGKPILWESR